MWCQSVVFSCIVGNVGTSFWKVWSFGKSAGLAVTPLGLIMKGLQTNYLYSKSRDIIWVELPFKNVIPGMFYLLLSNPEPPGSSSVPPHRHHRHARTHTHTHTHSQVASLDSLISVWFHFIVRIFLWNVSRLPRVTVSQNNWIQHLTINHKHIS